MNKTNSKITLIASCFLLMLSVFASAAMMHIIDFNSISKGVLGTTIGKTIFKSNCKPETYEEATVVKALDGDTIEIVGGCADKVRLLYIDTPETVKPNTPVQCYGPEASNYSKSRLTQGTKVYLQSDKESNDKYGRSLRILYFEKEDLDNFQKSYNYELATKGFGTAKFFGVNKKYKAEMLQGQDIAKRQNIGIWQACKLI